MATTEWTRVTFTIRWDITYLLPWVADEKPDDSRIRHILSDTAPSSGLNVDTINPTSVEHIGDGWEITGIVETEHSKSLETPPNNITRQNLIDEIPSLRTETEHITDYTVTNIETTHITESREEVDMVGVEDIEAAITDSV